MGAPGGQKHDIHLTLHVGPTIQRVYLATLCLHHHYQASFCYSTITKPRYALLCLELQEFLLYQGLYTKGIGIGGASGAVAPPSQLLGWFSPPPPSLYLCSTSICTGTRHIMCHILLIQQQVANEAIIIFESCLYPIPRWRRECIQRQLFC